MSKEIDVYWASANYGKGIDWQLTAPEPKSLKKIMMSNRNPNNKGKESFLKCPAVTSLLFNVFTWNSPVKTSIDLIVKDDMVYRNIESDNPYFDWMIQHDATLKRNILVNFMNHIIFFSDEEVEVMVSAPYFSQAQHLQYGAIVPGKFNIGSWFRPINAEINLWENVSHIDFYEDEPIAYFTFLTDKKVNLKQFRLTEELQQIASSCSQSTQWLPNKTLAHRYEIFKQRRMKDMVLSKIKDSLL